jgi:hypothetical protein
MSNDSPFPEGKEKGPEWSKAWTVLARLDAGIVGSNPTRSMDVYVYVLVRLFYVCVVLCTSR